MDTLQDFIDSCSLDQNAIILPEEQAPAKIYASFKKLMQENLGKYKSPNLFLFANEKESKQLLSTLKKGERPRWKKDREWYATSQEVAFRMFNTVIPLCGEYRILEPSAGRGDIVDALMEFSPYCFEHTIHCVEIDNKNRQFLEKKGYQIVGADFMEWEHEKPYDIIYANPPFTPIYEHVEKMITHLNNSGDLVCVVPSSFDSERFEDIEGVDCCCCYDLPSGSFRKVGTSINTKIFHFSFNK